MKRREREYLLYSKVKPLYIWGYKNTQSLHLPLRFKDLDNKVEILKMLNQVKNSFKKS